MAVTRIHIWRAVRVSAFYLIVTLGAIVSIVPIVYMFSASLMPQWAMFVMPPHVLPVVLRLANYRDIFVWPYNLHGYLFNSVVVTVSVVALNVFFCGLVGYGLAKFAYPGQKIIFYLILCTMMVPFSVIVVPLYILVRDLGWTNTYFGLIVPSTITPFGVFLVRQFFVSLPDDYLDAARIDGCSEIGIFLRIVMPLGKPVLSALAVITFMSSWNSFFWPLIVTSEERYRTLPLGLARFIAERRSEWALLMAAATVATVPVIILFLILQRRFIEGMAGLSGLKG